MLPPPHIIVNDLLKSVPLYTPYPVIFTLQVGFPYSPSPLLSGDPHIFSPLLSSSQWAVG